LEASGRRLAHVVGIACILHGHEGMGHLSHFGIVALGCFASLISCSTSGLMGGSEDEMAGSQSAGNVNSACSACFENNCAWQTTECAADPACATWLTCAKTAPMGDFGGVDESFVRASCSDVSGTAGALQDSVVECVTVDGCCAARTDLPGGGGTGGNYDSADGGAVAPTMDGGNAWEGDAESTGDGHWSCPEDSCTCLQCLEGSKNSDQDNACGAALAACGTTKCSVFMSAYAGCHQQVGSANAAGSSPEGAERALDSCMFLVVLDKFATGDVQYQEGFEQFMQTAFDCVAVTCSQYCIPEEAQGCVACQQKVCADELENFRTSTAAVLGTWCRSYCQTHLEDAECPGKCGPYLQEGAETLSTYGECVQSNCPEC